MRHDNSIRGIYIKRLRFSLPRGTGSWVAYMRNSHSTFQSLNITGTKDIPHQSGATPKYQTPIVTRCNSSSILPAVLNDPQATSAFIGAFLGSVPLDQVFPPALTQRFANDVANQQALQQEEGERRVA